MTNTQSNKDLQKTLFTSCKDQRAFCSILALNNNKTISRKHKTNSPKEIYNFHLMFFLCKMCKHNWSKNFTEECFKRFFSYLDRSQQLCVVKLRKMLQHMCVNRAILIKCLFVYNNQQNAVNVVVLDYFTSTEKTNLVSQNSGSFYLAKLKCCILTTVILNVSNYFLISRSKKCNHVLIKRFLKLT